jgi:hypothetical protein
MRSAGQVSYNSAVRKLHGRAMRLNAPSAKVLVIGLVISPLIALLAGAASAQESLPASTAAQAGTQTKIQVNFLNSCRPAQADLEEMGRALALVKERPGFAADFEISRGVTTLTEAEARAAGAPEGSAGSPSRWVRIRKEFPDKAPLTDAQYSLSVEGNSASETLALHLRESKEVLQILISDSVTGSAVQVVKANTPPDRIRIERFGKASIVLARCGAIDQSAYEPLFRAADGIMEQYRTAMAVRTVVPAELAQLPRGKESKAADTNH